MQQLYDIHETAAFLRMTAVTLRKLVKRKKIHFRRIANKLLFTEADIREYVDDALDAEWGKRS